MILKFEPTSSISPLSETPIISGAPNYIQVPRYAGYYRIGSATEYLAFNLQIKPNWFHRMFTKLLLGWEWVDNV